MKNLSTGMGSASVLSEIMRDRQECASAHGMLGRNRHRYRMMQVVAMIVLWSLVFLAITGSLPEPIEGFFLAAIRYVRNVGVHVLNFLT